MGQLTMPSSGSAPLPPQREQVSSLGTKMFGLQAANRVFQVDLEVVADVVALLRLRPARPPRAEQVAEAEEVAENIAEIGERRRIEAGAKPRCSPWCP